MLMSTSLEPSEYIFDIGQIGFFENVLSTWIADEQVTVACGMWEWGAIMELVPQGGAQLLPSNYTGRFAGVRELRISGVDHHLHIDLGRIHSIEYRIAPCVCLGSRPSFDICFLSQGPGGARTGRTAISVMVSKPYRTAAIRKEPIRTWFLRYFEHVQARPDLVRLVVDPAVAGSNEYSELIDLLRAIADRDFSSWPEAISWLTRHEHTSGDPEMPSCKALVEQALALSDASLVIFRDRTLVEFKTDELGGLFEYREGEHTSWQLGRFESHHCHLALNAVTGVEFSAESVPCQGGRLNYTIWFLVSGSCGNPFRSDGYFSVVLNNPYDEGLARYEVIDPVLNLYRRYRHLSWVHADAGFLSAIESRDHRQSTRRIFDAEA